MKSVMKIRTLGALDPRARIAQVIVAVAFAGLFAAACGGISEPGVVTSLTISPTSVTLAPGGTQQFTVEAKNSGGDVLAIPNPTWSVTAGGGTITSTGLYTAGTTAGTFTVSVTCSGITATATVTVTAGPLLTITVAPDTTLVIGATAQFRAVGRDAFGNVVAITPVWSTVNPPGSINATGLFTAGTTTGTFNSSVRATQGAIFGTANVTVIAPPPPPPPPPGSIFTVLANQAVTCTGGSITGDVGTFQAAPTGTITPSCIPITTGTVHAPGDAASVTAYNNFLSSYTSLAAAPCGAVLTGTLAGVTLPPGVYCFDAAAAPTGVLTLDGPPTGVWLFKIGTSGTGALTGNLFSVVMAGGAQACNVTWWVRQAATMTDSDLKGSVLAGAGITLTRGTFNGNAWAGASGVGDVTITGTAVTGCP